MFVFPAFNSNYTSRKRSLNSCSKCREKKVRCVIRKDKEGSAQCTYCYTHDEICDVSSRVLSKNVKKKKTLLPKVCQLSQRSGFSSGMGSNSKGNDRGIEAGRYDDTSMESEEAITPEYLKKKFNFNLSYEKSQMTYQYVFHDHPKAVMGNKIGDANVWHESGVYLESKIPSDNAQNYHIRKIYKRNNDNTKFQLKNRKHYEFLLSINAFSLSDPDFRITPEETKRLLEIYFYKINSIFPIIDEEDFWRDYDDGRVSTILVYVLVLAIARDSLAEDILKSVFQRNPEFEKTSFTEEAFKIHFRSFCENLYNKINHVKIILSELGDYNKLNKLLVSLVLTLHWNFDHQGNEQSSKSLTDAINYAVSLAIHMEKLDPAVDSKTKEYLRNLWWVCFVFDRFNSLINSRVSFVKTEDCNLSLPDQNTPLFRVVNLSFEIEKMLGSVYMPYKSFEMYDVVWLYKKKQFDADSYQKLEFNINNRDRESGFNLCDGGLSMSEPQDYVNRFVYFLTRVIRNVNIMASQKLKYDNKRIPNEVPDEDALRASQNILFYFKKMDDNSIMNIPLIPWCVSLAMAPSLKNRTRRTLQKEKTDNLRFQWEDYMEQLKKQSLKWWIAEDICNSAHDFFGGLERTVQGRETHPTRHTTLNQDAKIQQPKPTTNILGSSVQNEQTGPGVKTDQLSQNSPIDENLEFLDPDFFNSHFNQFDLLDLGSLQQLPDTFELSNDSQNIDMDTSIR